MHTCSFSCHILTISRAVYCHVVFFSSLIFFVHKQTFHIFLFSVSNATLFFFLTKSISRRFNRLVHFQPKCYFLSQFGLFLSVMLHLPFYMLHSPSFMLHFLYFMLHLLYFMLHVLYFMINRKCAIFHISMFYISCYKCSIFYATIAFTIYQERSLILNSQLFSLTSCKTRYSCQSQVILMRNPKCFLFLIFNCICSILREFISRVFSCNLKIFWDIIFYSCPGTL